MNASVAPRSLSRRQLGAASVGIAMLIMFILTAAVVAVMNMSGSSVIDAANNEEQVAALFIAESGVERAQATISAAAVAGTFTGPTCEALSTVTGSLGRGAFTYVAKAYVGTTLSPSCGVGANPACTSCVVETTGTIGTSTRRTVRTVISSTSSDGASGCGDSFTLNLNVPVAFSGKAAIFSHVAWRARPDASACGSGDSNNADLTICNLANTTPCTTTNGWHIYRTGTNNSSSFGHFEAVPASGDYSLHVKMEGSGGSATRSYAATGVVMFPIASTAVAYIGSYGQNGNTSSTSSLDGFTPNDWTCGLDNATPNTMSRAAGADTLFYGLSALGVTAGSEATSLVYGAQPMYRISSLTGGNGDFLYSQSWLTYNPAYWPLVTGATNGANFTGSIGATFTGTITTAGTPTLTLNSALNASAVLALGDTITNNAGTVTYGTLGTLTSGTWGTNGSTYNINATTNVGPATLRATSNSLHVIGAPSSGVLTQNDSITNSADTVTYGTLDTSVACSTTVGPGPCNAGDSVYAFTGTATQLNSQTLHTAGTTITVPAGGTAIPSAGTALGVLPSGTGAFSSVSLVATSSITGTTLTVPSGTQPNLGDTLYGRSVQPGTRITAILSGTTYTVTPSQTASAGTILARAAIRGADSGAPAPTATSFVVSSKPTTRLSASAQLCGGVCPFLFPFTGSGGNNGTHFTITGLPSGRDWSSGFACLNNVDPYNIRYLSRIVASRGSWSEPVR